MKKILLATALVLSGTSVSAIDGNELLSNIRGAEGDFAEGLSSGYILGIHNTLQAAGFICTPNGVSGSQIADIMEDFLVNNPKIRHEGAFDLIYTAFTNTFPCNGNT